MLEKKRASTFPNKLPPLVIAPIYFFGMHAKRRIVFIPTFPTAYRLLPIIGNTDIKRLVWNGLKRHPNEGIVTDLHRNGCFHVNAFWYFHIDISNGTRDAKTWFVTITEYYTYWKNDLRYVNYSKNVSGVKVVVAIKLECRRTSTYYKVAFIKQIDTYLKLLNPFTV